MKKKLLVLLLAITMLMLPIQAYAEEAAVTPTNGQNFSFNQYYADTMRDGMNLKTEKTFRCNSVEVLTETFGLSGKNAQYMQAIEDLLNELTVTEQVSMNGGSMTMNLSGTDVFTVAVESVDGVLYISSDLSDRVLAIDADAIPQLLNAVTDNAFESSEYFSEEVIDDMYGQIEEGASDGMLTINQAMLGDDSEVDQASSGNGSLALLAEQFPNTAAWIGQRIASCTSEVTEQPEGCDPAAICISLVKDNASVQDMKTAFLTDVLADEELLTAVTELASAFTGTPADRIADGFRISLDVANAAKASRSEGAPDAPDGMPPEFDESKINEYDIDRNGSVTVYMDEQGNIVKASWVINYKNSDQSAADLTEESSDLTLKLDYARNTEGETVEHTLNISALVLGNEFACARLTAAAADGAVRDTLDCHADVKLMGTTVLSADLNAFTDADNVSGFNFNWTDSEGQSRGVVLSSEWTITEAPAEDVASVIEWVGSLRGLNTEPLDTIYCTYTSTYDPFTVEGKEDALVLGDMSEEELDALADEYTAGAVQCAAKVVSLLPKTTVIGLLNLLETVNAN